MAIPVDGQITLAPRDTATSATRRRWRFGRAGGNGRTPKPNAEKAQAGAGDLAVASVGEQRQLEGHAHPEGLSPQRHRTAPNVRRRIYTILPR